MATVRATATMIDGSTYTAEGTYLGLADRIVFERKYGKSVSTIVRDDDLMEEPVAFLVHRMLERSDPAVGDFEAFVNKVQDIKIEAVPDPTDPAAPATS